jgi:glutamate synthase domain-containing protein 2
VLAVLAVLAGALAAVGIHDVIQRRPKGVKDEQAYGTERDVAQPGYEWLLQSMHSFDPPTTPPRIRIGGPDCTRPYEMALLNVSAMSFGALSGNALTALNQAAAKGGFARAGFHNSAPPPTPT